MVLLCPETQEMDAIRHVYTPSICSDPNRAINLFGFRRAVFRRPWLPSLGLGPGGRGKCIFVFDAIRLSSSLEAMLRDSDDEEASVAGTEAPESQPEGVLGFRV